jgi:hypothetical protein
MKWRGSSQRTAIKNAARMLINLNENKTIYV